MVLTDGERLQGKFESSKGSSVKFKSDVLGELTVDWSKIKELHTAQPYAVIPKDAKLNRKTDTSKIPQGAISVADRNITVTPAAGQTQTIPVGTTGNVVDQTSFQNAIQRSPSFFADWGGTVTAGASLVEATQQSNMFNTAISLVRISPDEDWLQRRNRTEVDFSNSYGTLREPGTPVIKTNIYHAGVQRDEYFSDSVYAFAQGMWDHNFSQGLDLQQSYGGGIGWSVIHRPDESLDLKAGITYVRQSFTLASSNENLAGSTFEEDYRRNFARGMVFNQALVIMPAWNVLDATSVLGSANLTVPVYKRMGFTLGVIDNYLNNPPPGFKKNSLQATMGLTYSLR